MKVLKLILPALLLLASCAKQEVDYAKYVNPFVGTGGHGHVYPGAVAPYPMIQASPDTRMYQWDACAGYHYTDTTINGFSHNHLSGTGCGDYGDILIMPMIGTPDKLDKEGEKSQEMPFCSPFSHENEVAEPGYYSVMLEKHSILTELTATQRAAIYRFTFPETDSATILLDMDYSLSVFGDQRNDVLDLQVVGDNAICGSKQTKGWAWEQAISFYAEASQPFTYTIINDTVQREGVDKPRLKALLNFKAEKNTPIYFKIALSGV
ncbi:MAG: glycoside hydrolase family 92 protein, partial [Muribaculaceae bacterium]|nr:glycoside hydrolase family 92 protein [Muribaculaceae bacterium]